MQQGQNLFQRYPLWVFFVLAYVFQFAVTGFHLYLIAIPSPWRDYLHAFTPTFAALIVAAGIGGSAQIRKLLSGWTRWRVSWIWYLAAFSMTGFPLLIAIVNILLGNEPAGLAAGGVGFWVGAVIYNMISGPLGEETGWRGFALPRLQTRFNALTSSLILGVLWAFWHVPLYLEPGGGQQTGFPFYIFIPMTIALSVFFVWIYNNTGGSLLLTFLTHFFFNFSGAFVAGRLGLMPTSMLFMVAGPLLFVYIVVVVILAGPRHLSRKRVAIPAIK
jgi:membrane protease YdiL (CAAX protease family)